MDHKLPYHEPFQMLIGDECVPSVQGEVMPIIDPATEEILTTVPRGSKQDAENAVTAAEKAYASWKSLSIKERSKYIQQLADAIEAEGESLTRLDVIDSGNTITKMRADITKAVGNLRYYAGLGYEMKGVTVPSSTRGLHFTIREPWGVVGRLVPFNHPLQFAASRIAAPLIAGNTVVLKPSDQAPLSACVLGRMIKEIFPPGVVNVVTGYGHEIGDAIVSHPKVRRIAFTGSTNTGLRIQQSAAASGVLKTLSMELGGKNAMIIFPDASLDRAIAAAANGMNFSWQGQSCGSTSRLLVHENVYDRVIEGVLEKVRAIHVGDPLDEKSNMGPMITEEHYHRVLGYIEKGKAQGAILASGGESLRGAVFPKGYWIQPTVFTDVQPAMDIAREEIFGPVLSIMKWADDAEVVSMANGTDYGLAASVWTNDVPSLTKMIKEIDAGYIWVNGVSAHFTGMPFGGYKNSGLGKEEGLDELLGYTQLKSVNLF